MFKLLMEVENNINILEERPYQNEAIFSILNFVKNLLRGVLEKDLNKIFQNAALLNMATGSGKTFTIGTALNNIIKLRNRFNGIKNKEKFQNLNIVVLTHRIDLVNQFRDDLVYGRDDKTPILNENILDSLHISTYHSKADKEDNFLVNEEDNLGSGINKDNIIFSTYQTAGLEKIVDKLDYIDIILIDESHNVKLDSEYEKILKELSLKTRTGEESLILPVTATPNNQTKKLFGQEIFDYGLEKYLNSEYSPNVEYNLVTNSNADKKLIERLSAIVEESKHTENIKLKKKLIKEAEELFAEIMSSFVDNEALVDDLFERAGENGKLDETVIFCDSIKSADELAELMNKKRGIEGYALAFHSKNDSNDAIAKLRDKNDPCKVILSIGKLNEGIDLPKVKNVVFWRGTDSETIFFQQFGRGLRGDDLVRYFDYVGGIKNFAWINEIFVKYNKIADSRDSENSGGLGVKKKFSLLGGSMGISHHNIDLVDIGLDILNMKNKLNLSKEELIEYFKNKLKENGILDMESLIELGSMKYQKKYGVTEIGIILGIKLSNIKIENLKQLGVKLGYFDIKKEEYIKNFKNKLKINNIIDMESLINFGIEKYRLIYGGKDISIILGRKLSNIKMENLKQLGVKIGFIEYIENFKNRLKENDILDMESLIKFGPKKYEIIYGRKEIGFILGRKLVSVKKENLKELGEQLGFFEVTKKECLINIKIKLKENNITDMESLITFGVKKYNNEDFKKEIGIILGKQDTYIGKKDIKLLGIELGYIEVIKKEYVEKFKNKLKQKNIISKESLNKLGPIKYRKEYGLIDIRYILGNNISYIKKENLKELGKILFDKETPKKQD